MKFKKEDLLSITEEEYPEGFMPVEAGEWVQDYKNQLKETIFGFQGKFYALSECRSGSPFTDWYYDSEYWPDELDVPEVEAVEIIKTQWREVK